MKFKLSLLAIGALLFASSLNVAIAQEVFEVPVREARCGDIIEGEFVNNYEAHRYSIRMDALDVLDLAAYSAGEQLAVRIGVRGPSDLLVIRSDAQPGGDVQPESQPAISTGALSASGNYTIFVVNYELDQITEEPNETGGIGLYTLDITCRLRDGSVIEPGMVDIETSDEDAPEDTTVAPVADENFVGFRGLSAVSFEDVANIPLSVDVPVTGGLAPSGDVILGHGFDAAAGETYDLTVARISGNLNIGVAVFNETYQTIFVTTLIASNDVSTTFTIPADGQYTVGIFRADVTPPAAPEATAFTVMLTRGG